MPNSNRRTFLKGVGQSMAATSLLGMDLPEGAWLVADAQGTQPEFNENKMECDVLVVGGGFAACFAAIKAKEQGAQVIMVDKGYAGRSGQSPWANFRKFFDPEKGPKIDDLVNDVIRRSEYIANRYWVETLYSRSNDMYHQLVSWGLPSESKAPGGKAGQATYGLRQYAEKIGVKVIDRVMVVELLKQNGRIAGAIGISSASNTYDRYTFIAKATVLGIGACSYKPTGPAPIYQLTGDGEAMAWRAGAEVFGKEFVSTFWGSPDIPIARYGTAFRGIDDDKLPENLRAVTKETIASYNLVNAAGDKLPDRSHEPRLCNHVMTYLTLELEAHAGRAPVYAIGGDGSKWEVIGGSNMGMSIQKSDGLWPADKECRSSIPGLFAAGDALGISINGADFYTSSSVACMITGSIAGENAAKEAAKMDKPAVSQEEIDRAKQFVNAPRERKGGFSPRWVTQLLQNTMSPYFVYFIKKADRLQAALTQIEFMQQHLVPMLLARDPHELRLAHETKSMVLSAEFRLHSALFRNESRGNHYREDFPRRDDKNWLAWTKIKPVDGKMTLVKVPVPKEWQQLDASLPYEQRYPFRFPGE
jgi:succinate dehydrogenase/fumarate reductase flavoprotein subunit